MTATTTPDDPITTMTTENFGVPAPPESDRLEAVLARADAALARADADLADESDDFDRRVVFAFSERGGPLPVLKSNFAAAIRTVPRAYQAQLRRRFADGERKLREAKVAADCLDVKYEEAWDAAYSRYREEFPPDDDSDAADRGARILADGELADLKHELRVARLTVRVAVSDLGEIVADAGYAADFGAPPEVPQRLAKQAWACHRRFTGRRPGRMGRAPRPATNKRARGSRRNASRGSPSRGDPDDGESDPPGDLGTPPARRETAGIGGHR